MKFYHSYRLKKELPNYKKGWIFRWCGSRERFFPAKAIINEFRFSENYGKIEEDIYNDYTHQGFTVEEIKNKDWFIPQGEERDFIPKFPNKEEIDNFVYLNFQTRLVVGVDECRCMKRLFNSDQFQDDLYEFVKNKYNDFFNLK